ncbi:MAG: nucleoside triphosphate pyrophosphohydrolase [Clostridia bacterium]|nr:nucleoside triphosphate pyrophosphohydrolase [Clostridia bacterium]
MERIYNKLVRDNIPNIIEEKGEIPVTRILDDDTYKIELEKKLNEEYQEVLAATGEDRVEELADMLEIIRALAKLEGKTLQDVIEIADKKNEKRGAFEKKIFLEKVLENN